MAIGVQLQTKLSTITIVGAEMNNHLRSRGFRSTLRELCTAEADVGSAVNNTLELVGEIIDVLKDESSQKKNRGQCSYFLLNMHNGLNFVNAMLAFLTERKYDLIISTPNEELDQKNLRNSRAEFPEL